MKPSNQQILAALLDGDPTITPGQREGIIALASNRPAPIIPLLLRQIDVAQMMGVSRQTVWAWAKNGILNPVEIGCGNPKFKRDDVLKLIEQGS